MKIEGEMKNVFLPSGVFLSSTTGHSADTDLMQ